MVATVVVLEFVIVSVAVLVTVTSEVPVVRVVLPLVIVPVKLAASRVAFPSALISSEVSVLSVFVILETLRRLFLERSTSVKTL